MNTQLLSPDAIRGRINQEKSAHPEPPSLTTSDDIPAWRKYIEDLASACNIHPNQYFVVGLHFIHYPGLLTEVMVECERCNKLEGDLTWENYGWEWTEFLESLKECIARNSVDVQVAGGAALGAILAPIVVPVAVEAVGFASGGIVAGSIAAAAYPVSYGIGSSAMFSMLQSIGAVGLGPVGFIAVTAVGVVVGGAIAAVAAQRREERR